MAVDPKVLKESAGWSAGGLAAVILGLLIAAGGNDIGNVIAVLGALVIAFCLASIAFELLRKD